MEKYIYDTAQVCASGHVTNLHTVLHPECNEPYCSECGDVTISACPVCNTPIRSIKYWYEPIYGASSDLYNPFDDNLNPNIIRSHKLHIMPNYDYEPPAFCYKCGAPYPWTQARLKAAEQIIDMLPNLPQDKIQQLKDFIPDLMYERPNTTYAALIYGVILESLPELAKASVTYWLKQNAIPAVLNFLHIVK